MSIAWKSALPIPTYFLAQCSPQGQEQFYLASTSDGGPALKAEFLVPHRKDFYFLVLVRRGGGRHWVDLRRYTKQADTVYFTAQHQVRLVEEARPLEGIALGFTADFLSLDHRAGFAALPLLHPGATGHELRLDAADLAFLEPVLAHMAREYRDQQPWHLDMLRADLRAVLIHLSRLYQQQHGPAAATEPALLEKFIGLVETHHAALHQVAGYAELLHLSPGYLNERVRHLSGQPALAHIHARLVLEVKRYLFHTGLSVAEISFALGFDDPSYFGRFFRRDTGLSPARYRAATVEMYQ